MTQPLSRNRDRLHLVTDMGVPALKVVRALPLESRPSESRPSESRGADSLRNAVQSPTTAAVLERELRETDPESARHGDGGPRDADLVSALLEGDRGALEHLYRRHSEFAFCLAVRLQGHNQDIEDVVHDLFLKAQASLASLQDASAFRGWLGSIVVNEVRGRLRKGRFLRALRLQSAEPVDLDSLASPAAGPDIRAQLAQVYTLLRLMVTEERIAWTLRFVEHYRLEEVAELCGCSLATVKRRLLSAQRFLQEHLVTDKRKDGSRGEIGKVVSPMKHIDTPETSAKADVDTEFDFSRSLISGAVPYADVQEAQARTWKRLSPGQKSEIRGAARRVTSWQLSAVAALCLSTFVAGLWVGKGERSVVSDEPRMSAEPLTFESAAKSRSAREMEIGQSPDVGEPMNLVGASSSGSNEPSNTRDADKLSRVNSRGHVQSPGLTGATRAPTSLGAVPELASEPASSVVEGVVLSAPAGGKNGVRPSWHNLANKGEYEAALVEIAQAGGYERVLATSNPEQLMLLSDVARATGQQQRALAALRRIVNEH